MCLMFVIQVRRFLEYNIFSMVVSCKEQAVTEERTHSTAAFICSQLEVLILIRKWEHPKPYLVALLKAHLVISIRYFPLGNVTSKRTGLPE